MSITGQKAVKYTATEKLRYIDAVLRYIEKHLPDELNPENIAERHYISLSQLYRDFYACTGHSIKEYVRKRRISNACEKIKCSNMPLAVIANGSGYETQQAFHKQFKSTVGMTPFEYNRLIPIFIFTPLQSTTSALPSKSARKQYLSVRPPAFTIPA